MESNQNKSSNSFRSYMIEAILFFTYAFFAVNQIAVFAQSYPMFIIGRFLMGFGGAVDNSQKRLNNGYSVCSFTMGSQRLYDYINNNPAVLFKSCTYTNDPYTIGLNNKFVSINATLEVDLYGQASSETVKGMPWSGTGGQSETVQGSQMSKGGKSSLAMHSTYTTKDENGNDVLHSKIVSCLHPNSAVTTSWNDTDYVVTEYGVAWLRGLTIGDRAKELIKIAHPAFREQLAKEAEELCIW